MTAGDNADDESAVPTHAPAEAAAATRHRLKYAARSDRGLVRNNNQDSVFAGDRLLVVADGMGGHAAGDRASRLVVDALQPVNEVAPSADLSAGLIAAITRGNEAIAATVRDDPELDGMGTTVTAMLFDGPRAAIAHVGDSRAYLYRSGVLHQLTHDDSFVQSLVDEGRITEGQAHAHPQRNLLLRALTGSPLEPSTGVRDVRPGDRFLLCSDGLSGVVDAEPIGDALAHPDPEVAADTLVQLALVAGGPDNVTVIVADVADTGDGQTAPIPALDPPDPDATGPLQRLTRELPRVPLPPIPEEPGGTARVLPPDDFDDADDFDEDFDEDDDFDDDEPFDSGEPFDNDEPPDNEDGGSDESGLLEPDRDETDARAGRVGGAIADDTRQAPSTPDGHATRPRTGRRPTATPPGRGPKPSAAGARRRREPRRAGRRHPWRRRTALIVAVVVLAGVALTASTLWVRSQYYVGTQANLVGIFRGINESVFGLRLSSFEETSCGDVQACAPIKVTDLEPAAQHQVQVGIQADSLADARRVVARLRDKLLPVCPAGTAEPGTTGPGTAAVSETPPPAITSRAARPGPQPGVTCRIVG